MLNEPELARLPAISAEGEDCDLNQPRGREQKTKQKKSGSGNCCEGEGIGVRCWWGVVRGKQGAGRRSSSLGHSSFSLIRSFLLNNYTLDIVFRVHCMQASRQLLYTSLQDIWQMSSPLVC